MIQRNKLVIAAIIAAVLMLVTIGIVWAVGQSGQSTGISSSGDPRGNESDHDHYHTDESADHEPFLVDHRIGEESLSPDEINQHILPRAEQAALEFVRQSSTEPEEARKARLGPLFTPGSSAVNYPKPSVDHTRTENTRAVPSLIGSDWETRDSELVATVFLEIVTVANSSPEIEVARINQAYEVIIVPYDGNYLARDIYLSDRPLVIRR